MSDLIQITIPVEASVTREEEKYTVSAKLGSKTFESTGKDYTHAKNNFRIDVAEYIHGLIEQSKQGQPSTAH